MRLQMILPLAALLSTAACNTVEGFGRDLSATGNAISGASRDARSPHKTGARAPKCQVETSGHSAAGPCKAAATTRGPA